MNIAHVPRITYKKDRWRWQHNTIHESFISNESPITIIYTKSTNDTTHEMGTDESDGRSGEACEDMLNRWGQEGKIRNPV